MKAYSVHLRHSQAYNEYRTCVVIAGTAESACRKAKDVTTPLEDWNGVWDVVEVQLVPGEVVQ